MKLARLLFILLGYLCFVAAAEEPALTQKPPPPELKPVVMDEGAKKAFENWEKMSYHLGRAGVKKAQCTIKAKLVNPVYPKPVDGEGKYAWDIEKKESQASLEWDSEAIGLLLRQHGWSAQMLSENYDPEYLKRSLAGAKLTAKTEGERTIIKVEGETPSACKEIGFDKNGVLDVMTVEVPVSEEVKLTSRLQLSYTQEDGKYFCTKQQSVMEVPGQAPNEKKVIETKLQFTFGKSGDYHVLTKAEMEATADKKPLGTSTLEFSEYKFNADAGK